MSILDGIVMACGLIIGSAFLVFAIHDTVVSTRDCRTSTLAAAFSYMVIGIGFLAVFFRIILFA